METTTSCAYQEFILGFASALKCDTNYAKETWATWSNQLTDSERMADEARGKEWGFELGKELVKFFSEDVDSDIF